MDPKDYPGNEETPCIPLAAEKYAPIFRALLSTKIIHKPRDSGRVSFSKKNNAHALFFERIFLAIISKPSVSNE